MLRLFAPQWGAIWRSLSSLLKRPSPIKLNGWRCTFCKTDRYYVEGVLTPSCAEQRTTEIEGTTYTVACPLAPIDDNGKELTYEEWSRAK